MNLQSIKQKIAETKELSERVIPPNSKARSGLEGAKNQATVKLEELKNLFREEIRKNTKLHLVYGPDVVFNSKTPPNVFVFNHNNLAKILSTGVINSIKPGTGLLSYHLTPLNEMLKELCIDMGVKTAYLPDIGMQEKFMSPIRSHEHLVDTLEAMLECYMKSNEEEQEGHALQAIFTSQNYLTAVESSSVNEDLHLFVFVPSLTRDIKASYGRFLTDNIDSISFKNTVLADNYYNDVSELQSYVNSLAPAVPLPKVEKPKKKKEKIELT